MATAHDRIGPWSRPPARRRGWARAVLAMLAAFALATACVPRPTPVAGDDTIAASVRAPDTRRAPRRSAGCDRASAASAPERVHVAGTERTFLARVPPGDHRTPRDLVLAFHGRSQGAGQLRRYAGLDAALPDAIVVYPRALAVAPGALAWGAPDDPPERQRDFTLVDALIADLGDAHCLDLDRVFVVGHSLGAYFANDVACRLGDRVRAVASVAGGLQGDGCVGGAAALLVHHPDDRLVPVRDGMAARDAFRHANALGAAPAVPLTARPLARLRCARHGAADVTDPVVWCARDDATTPQGGYGPHTWPQGAAAAIGAFFESLPR
ncbi:MAG: hypothetical protein WD336_05655 [Trueperaceae bacterium]